MKKERPYPLRLETETIQRVRRAADASGLPMSQIMRMALDIGLKTIDWRAFKSPPILEYPRKPGNRLELNEKP